jgi:hypothetical protein
VSRAFVAAFLFLFSSAAFAADGGDPTATGKAVAAAKAWLAQVDQGAYAASWEAAATPFKAAVTPEQWETSMKSVRAPLGAVVVRKMKSAKFTTTLPGAPDGNYVVITYRTGFAAKKRAVETVTPLLDADGAWHVAGYFIK